MDLIKTKFLLPIVISSFIIILGSNLIVDNYIISSLDNKLIDYHFIRRGNISEEEKQVIILGISDETIKELPPEYNQWPLPRNLYAKVIHNLNQVGVTVIGFDLLFKDEDRYSKYNDSIFRSEISRFNNVVLAAKLEQLDWRMISIERNFNNYSNHFYTGNDDMIGLVNIIPDYDGIIRRYYHEFYDPTTNKNLLTFSLSVFKKYNEIKNVEFDKLNIKKNKEPFLINYYGPSKTFTNIELIDVLDDNGFKTKTEIETGIDINTWDDSLTGLKYSRIFENKIVLIGSIEPEDKDIHPVPISEDRQMQQGNLMYGVEIHANVVQMLLDNNFILKASSTVIVLAIFFIALLSNLIFFLIKKIKFTSLILSETINIIILFSILVIIYEISFTLFKNNYFLETGSISLTTFSIYLSNLVIHYISERKQKLMIKNMFSRYVCSKVVDYLVENPNELKLGGEKKELTILFSDLTDFTAISESIEPEILVDFINDYFNEMTEVIFKYNGTLDKFEGDALLAFWGAPIDDPDHSFNALNAALEIQYQTSKINTRWKEKLNFDIITRTGINTGIVIVGNMGSNKKFDYTVIGDDVNIAARLESINKFYGTNIIVSENTIKKNKDKFIFRELDILLVKGKKKPIKIFELISRFDENNQLDNILIKEFEQGIYYYRDKQFIKAKEYFYRTIKVKPDDKPSLLYIERCDQLIKTPPDKDWDAISEVLMK